ncbi:MAG: DUF5063 domain-containing protein [bacterium]|nr:DUF5063 domain-containing protein [bacterium]
MNVADNFANEARRFCGWAKAGPGSQCAALTALTRIVALYAAGLELPSHESIEPSDEDTTEVTPAELEAVRAATSGLPLDFYFEVFDPTDLGESDAMPEPVTGQLSDDILDIYADVARGLRAYDAGRVTDAQWEWSFHFRHHWGNHATSAIRALHWWLRQRPAS